MNKQLKKMGTHCIICGYGRGEQHIVEVLKRTNIPVVLNENRDSSIKHLIANNIETMRTEGCNDFQSLSEGVPRYDFKQKLFDNHLTIDNRN